MRFKKAYLEITNICNLSCSFCPGTRRLPKMMSEKEFSVLAGKLRPYTDYLYLHLMGEPLLHPELDPILETAGKLGYRVIVTTNGTRLEQTGDRLMVPAVHKVNISLQSFEANEGRDPEEYLRQVSAFAQNASTQGKIVVLRLWNNHGQNALNGRMLSFLQSCFPQVWVESRRGIRIGEQIWIENGDRFDWPDLGADELGNTCFCYGLRDQIGVLCDGTVVPCCLDHNGDIALGNLFEQELDEILSSDRAQNLYHGFSGRKAVEELCRKCGYARRFAG